MNEQTRRIGLLKAVGGSPRLVAVVLLTEHLAPALAAAAAGLGLGQLAAPLLSDSGAGLVGSPGAPSLTWSAVAEVAVVLGVPAGIGLVAAVGHGQTVTVPSVGRLLLVVLSVPLVVAGLTAIPARIAARRSAAEIRQGELA